MASRRGPNKMAAAAQGLTPVAGDADLTSCPNCYLYFDYQIRGNNNLVPRLLSCGHLVCSTCVGDLFCDGSLCCPTCCEIHNCESPAAFPAVPASPIPSPQAYIASNEGVEGLMPPPVSISPRPGSSPSLTASPSPASTGMPQPLFGSAEEGAGGPGASENRLTSFLNSVPGAEEGGGVGVVGTGTDNGMGSDEEGGGGGLCCLVTDCGRERMSSDYFCSRHMDKAKRVSWKAAKRMVQTMSKGLYSMSTVVQGEKLGQFLDTEMPSMDNLKPEILSERFQKQETVTLGEALFLIDQALELLKKEPNALELRAPIKIVGDLHGQFFDLISMLDNCGAPRDGSSYLFLGDYVDRGEFSCEVLLYLLALKVAHPDKIHLIRGNHECRSLTTHFGFKDECKAKYGLPVYYRFLRCFELMPLCAVVANDHGRYFCTHGGISPGLTSLDQIAALDRRAEPEMEGLLCDLLWADPSDDPGVTNIESLSDQELDGLLSSTFQFNRLRGCSVAFGYLAVRRFLDANDLMCVIRAHAVQEDGYYRHFEKALKKREVDLDKVLPPVITVFSAPNYCDRYGNRAAVLELMSEEVEPRVEHFECVDHPDRLNRPDRSEVHLTALIASCPYMPTTFRDFVKLAGRMGPAQPLTDTGDASESSSVVGTGTSIGDLASSEMDASLKGSAPSSPPPSRKDRSLTAHDLYELEAAHDRINELHPDYLNARIESCEDEGVSRLSTKANTPSSVSSLVGSTTKITVSELRNRFDPAARERGVGGHAAPRPVDMGKPSNTVTEITSIFEHKARSDRRKGLHVRAGSGSGGIVSQMKASIESKAKAAACSPSSGGQTIMKQKINVFEALTKQTRGDTVATKLTRVKDSALARRIWVDKVGMGSPPPLWRGASGSEERLSREEKRGGSVSPATRGAGATGGGRSGGGAGTVSQRRHTVGSKKNGKFPPPPPPGALVAQAVLGEGDLGGGGNARAPWRSPQQPQDTGVEGLRRSTVGSESGPELDSLMVQRDQRYSSEAAAMLVGDTAPRDQRSSTLPAQGSTSTALLEKVSKSFRREGLVDDINKLPSPPNLARGSTYAEDCAFTHAEILGLKLLFALMDQRGSEYIDGVALEEYADEQDDYAQEREIEACIKAVDVDCDGKIGLMDFICFAARLKCYYEGGVGLQKTLNHAGPSGKRPPGMSMPGDSDSDDDDDDDDEEEGEDEEEEENGEHAEKEEQEEEEQAAEDLRSDCHDTDASGLEAGAGPKVEAGSDGAAVAKAAMGDPHEETNGHAERALPDAARVDEDSAVATTSGSDSSTKGVKGGVNADYKNARVAETCDVDMGAGGVSPRAARNTDEEEAKPAPGLSSLAAAGDVPASSASAEPSTGYASPKSGASRAAAQAMLDVITVSSVSAAISAAVQAVTTPDRAQSGKPAGPGSAPTE